MASSLQYFLVYIILCSFNKFAVSKEGPKPTVTFALNLYRKIARSTDLRKNVLYSPFSVFASLRMLHVASKGSTRDQIEEATAWKFLSQTNQDALDMDIVEQFKDAIADNTLHIALKLWQQEFFCTVSCKTFIAKIKRLYNIDLEEINFAIRPEQSRKLINKWMELKTNGNIKNLIPDGYVTSASRFLLSVGLHFNVNWKYKFQKKLTAPIDFYLLNRIGQSNTKTVPAMSVTQTFRFIYSKNRKYGIVDIPFSSDKLSMVVVIPHLASAIRELEDDLTPAFVTRMLGTLDARSTMGTRMQLQLPKFKLDIVTKTRKYLEALNVSHIFHPVHADLSSIVGYRGLSLSNIYHKAGVTVADSADTAGGLLGSTNDVNNFGRYIPKLAINKPFVFIIRQKITGLILLMGRVMDPTAN